MYKERGIMKLDNVAQKILDEGILGHRCQVIVSGWYDLNNVFVYDDVFTGLDRFATQMRLPKFEIVFRQIGSPYCAIASDEITYIVVGMNLFRHVTVKYYDCSLEEVKYKCTHSSDVFTQFVIMDFAANEIVYSYDYYPDPERRFALSWEEKDENGVSHISFEPKDLTIKELVDFATEMHSKGNITVVAKNTYNYPLVYFDDTRLTPQYSQLYELVLGSVITKLYGINDPDVHFYAHLDDETSEKILTAVPWRKHNEV